MQLSGLQFSHAEYNEGMMLTGFSPKDCLTIGLLKNSAGTVVMNRVKLNPGDVVMYDDSQPYDFISSHSTLLTIVSIHKTLIEKEIPWLIDAADKKFEDKNSIFADIIEREWQHVMDDPSFSSNNKQLEAKQKRIVTAMQDAFEGQSGEVAQLTKGEQTALEVKSFLHDSIDEKVGIQSITEQFEVSDKTLETSFKSLFGLTPKQFITILKLNKAHEDLQLANAQTTNVSNIATKWGFSNFGRFAKDYKALFGVLPSETLTIVPTASS